MRYTSYLLSGLITWFAFINPTFAQKNDIKAADISFQTHQYQKALEQYKKGIKSIKKNQFELNRVNYQIGECYRIGGTKDGQKYAESQYLRLEKKNYHKIQPELLLRLAEIYKQRSDYDKALNYYRNYEKLNPKDPNIKNLIESCEKAKSWTDPANFTKHEVGLMSKINRKDANDFCPRWFDPVKQDELMFTSDREGSLGKGADTWTNKPFSDIWTSIKAKSKNTEWPGDWGAPQPLEDPTNLINTEVSEADAYKSPKKNLYFTRCPQDKKKVLGCYIYQVRPKGKGWGDTLMLNFAPDSFSVIHPFLTADELTIYFASDMPGGQGGFDIWKASRDKANKPFDAPVNLGPKINTSGNEVYPSLRGDTILYFSSDGLPGAGGLDIFMAKLLENGKVGDPENLLCPINSNGDDFGIVFDDTFTVDPETKAPYVEKGFFTSNRVDKTKIGVDNIYYFKLKPLLFTLSGFVKDGSNKQPIDGAEITLSGSDGTIAKIKTDVKGYYFFDREAILPNTTYEVSAVQKGYFEENNSATVTTIGLTQNTDLKQDLTLMPLPAEIIVLPEIRYDVAKWDLKDEYKDSLLYVYNILIKNPRLVIELRSHTDFRDTHERNDTLSQRRAESCVEFLVNEKKINPERIIPKGFGERQPRKLNHDITLDGITFKKGTVLTEEYITGLKTEKEKEAAHQLNRRTEMFILRSDFVDTAKKVAAVAKPVVKLVTQRTISLKLEKDIYTGTCIVNDKSFKYQLDLKSKEVLMSHELATKLLKERTIVASDFEKGSEAINAETGEISDNSVLYLNTMMLGDEYIQNVRVTVKKSVTPSFIVGGEFITEELGDFTLDKEKSAIIFNRKL